VTDAEIGKFCAIAAQVRIGALNHPLDRPSQHRFTYCPEYYTADAKRDHAFFRNAAPTASSLVEKRCFKQQTPFRTCLEGAVLGMRRAAGESRRVELLEAMWRLLRGHKQRSLDNQDLLVKFVHAHRIDLGIRRPASEAIEMPLAGSFIERSSKRLRFDTRRDHFPTRGKIDVEELPVFLSGP
jgi:hypothetical protein